MDLIRHYLLTNSWFPYLFLLGKFALVLYLVNGLFRWAFFFRVGDKAFLGLCLLLLSISRVPSILFKEQLNVDESQMIAQALTLRYHPFYWDGIDGTTIGPLDTYALIWPLAFGWPITYAAARVTALLLISLMVALLFVSLRLLLSPFTTRFCTLILILFFACTTHFDLVHYSSELVSLLLISGSWYLLIRAKIKGEITSQKGFVLGILLGCVPFAKLQCLPLASVVALAMIITLVRSNRPYYKPLGWLIVGSLLPILVTLLICWRLEVLDRFYWFYLYSNLFNYGEYNQLLFPATQAPLWQRVLHLPVFFLKAEVTFSILFIGFLAIGTAALLRLVVFHQRLSARMRWIGFWITGWLLVSFYSIARPGTEFVHHLLLVVLPLVWMMGLALEIISSQASWYHSKVFQLVLLAMSGGWFGITAWRYSRNPVVTDGYLSAMHTRQPHQRSAVSDWLLRYARANDRLAVWGWNMRFHVETQLAQGTSENHSFRSIAAHSLRGAYQQKYLADLSRSQPAFFIDASGTESPLMADRALYRHERFGALANYIAHHYRLAGQMNDARIYVKMPFPERVRISP